MARVTIYDSINKISNRFDLTFVAAYRPRQLAMGSTSQLEPDHDKSAVIALREIAAGKVGVEILTR